MNLEYKADGFYIGGRWTPPAGNEMISLANPTTGELYAETPRPTTEDADRAVAAARQAFDSRIWSALDIEDRAAVILGACNQVEPRIDEIARVSAFEIGAPVQLTRMMARMVRGVVAAMCRIAVTIPDREAGTGLWEYELQRDPAGVVVDIVPWNGPFSGTMMKSAQALLAGCTVISKPPPSAPFGVMVWAQALEAAGLPEGAFNILPAEASVSEHLVTHPDVDLVVFTGGTSVGRRVAELCGRQLKRVVLELGGKSAAVVLDDGDLQLAVDSVVSGVYFNSGQICSALSRMLVPRATVDEVTERLRAKASDVVIGDPLDDNTTMGPMASQTHYERVLRCIEAGRAEGAKLVFGGGRPASAAGGWYIEPTLFVGDNAMSIAREEIFGPVVTLIPHDGEGDAIRIANDSDFGLGGSVFSADLQRAESVASHLATGSVTVNGYTTNLLAPRDPFKCSGIGTVTGVAGYQAFRSSRVVNRRAAQGAWTPSQLYAS